jgi:hypothetical protein
MSKCIIALATMQRRFIGGFTAVPCRSASADSWVLR